MVARGLDLRQAQALASRWLAGRDRGGGEKILYRSRGSVFGVAASGGRPPALLTVLGLIYAPILASGSYAEWCGLRAMAAYLGIQLNGFRTLLAALWATGSRACPLADRVHRRRRGVVRMVGRAKAEPSHRTGCRCPARFFLLSPVLKHVTSSKIKYTIF